MRRWVVVLPLVALAGLVLLFAGYALKHDPHVDPAAVVGKPAPAVLLQPLQAGAPVSLRRARPGAYLVNFFASWCAPCVQEHPLLMAMKVQGMPIVGVAYKNAPDDAGRLLATRGDPYADVLMDPDGRAGVEFGITGVPETFLVGRDGRILAKQAGPLTQQTAEALAEKLDQD